MPRKPADPALAAQRKQDAILRAKARKEAAARETEQRRAVERDVELEADDPLRLVPCSSVQRLASVAGIKNCSARCKYTSRRLTREFTRRMLNNALARMRNDERRTLTGKDVEFAASTMVMEVIVPCTRGTLRRKHKLNKPEPEAEAEAEPAYVSARDDEEESDADI